MTTPSRALPLFPSPLLLFRQICLLAWVAGILAERETAQGLLFLILLLLCDLPRSGKMRRIPLLALCFAGGFLYAQARAVTPPSMPLWLEKASSLTVLPDGREIRPPAARLSATVRSVDFLPDNRLRIFLEDLVPSGTDKAVPYAGGLIWTWQNPETVPLPGQRLEALLRARPVRDMANPGLWSAERHWGDRGVFLRAWSKGADPEVRTLPEPEPTLGARLRAGLQRRFLASLRAGEERFRPARRQDRAGGDSVQLRESDPAPGDQGTSLSQGAAILPALIFGDRSLLTQRTTDLFSRATLAHSLSLSGLHLGYAAALGFALAWLVGRFFPKLFLILPRQRLGMLLGLFPASLYLWLGQAPVSLARAWIMFSFWALLLFLSRPAVLLDGLLAAAGVLLLLNPASLFSLSLQLSALSVAVIALVLSPVGRLTAACIPGGSRLARLARGGMTVVLISLCIQTALSPLTVRALGSLSLCFPLNLLWLPILGIWVMPLSFSGLLFSSLDLTGAAAVVLQLAALPANALLVLLDLLDSRGFLFAPTVLRPHWATTAGFWLACLAFPAALLRKGKVRFGILSCLSLALMAAPLVWSWQQSRETMVRLRVLDVGQGQALVVEWGGLAEGKGNLPSSGRALIDGGGFFLSAFDPGRDIVAPLLTDNAPPHLEAVINSHPDGDHLAGLLHILDQFRTEVFAANGNAPSPALASRLEGILAGRNLVPRLLKTGDRLELGPDLGLETLWPPSRLTGRTLGDNNASLVLRLVWKGQPLALLCGDAEAPALRRLLRRRADLRASVLVVPHHGSSGSLTPGFYEAVRPRLALVSCGYGNQWGFPSPRVRQALADLSIPVYSTAVSGQIQAIWRRPEEDPVLITARPFRPASSGERGFSGAPPRPKGQPGPSDRSLKP
ncbi:MAG: DNA internalization-related competence protein ComEC/Rec2 [Desulfovibrio sp.]|jgi:competence protein ComEC|nr:DNA internalization-related competence protein ComEC/Rec2 [Desulfovibrio sp.]